MQIIIQWLLENWETITAVGSSIIAVIGWVLKHRANLWERVKLKISEAIEKAEALSGANGEQKKEYAMSLIKAVASNFSGKRIDEELERQILLTKNVNVNKNNIKGEIVF